jgi:cytoskeletal protein RodZ
MMNQNEAFEPFMLESNAKNTQVSFKAKNLRSRERKKKIFSILIVFLILIIIGVCIIFDHIYLRKVAQQRINTSNSSKLSF